MPLVDGFGRTIEYLRVSVTDRCNLRCRYCMPPTGVAARTHDEILRYEEIVRVVEAAASLGVHRVRLTGGEPLVRKGIVDLVRLLAGVPGLDDLSMTTNATLLASMARDLAAAGLQRVNVSLDTLDAARYAEITRGGRLTDALAGLEAADREGLRPVKVNVVVQRGQNDDEVADLVGLSLAHPWSVRFIEAMPIGAAWSAADAAETFVSAQEIRERVEARYGALEVTPSPAGGGPARMYRIPGAPGTVGFIAARTQHFCATCNRLRLTADGRLRLCLLGKEEVDVRSALRAGATREELADLLASAAARRPVGHHLATSGAPEGRGMSQIGG